MTIGDLAALAPGAAPPLVRLAEALAHFPAVVLDEREARGVLDGRAPALRPAGGASTVPAGATLRLVDAAGRLLAVARLVAPGAPVEFLRVFKEP